MDIEIDVDAITEESLEEVPTEILLSLLDTVLDELVKRLQNAEQRNRVN